MNKNELRKTYIQIRNNIKDRQVQNNSIYNKVICDSDVINANTILIYVSTQYEVDTIKIIKYFIRKKRIAVPRIEDGVMNFYYIESLNELKEGYFNILEPITNNQVIEFDDSVCIVPGICFDKDNNRIGYGKAFYDRFLSNKKIITIGLSYKECIIECIPCDKYDAKLKKVIYQ